MNSLVYTLIDIFGKSTSHSEYICRAFHQYEFSGVYLIDIFGKSTSHTEYIDGAFHLYEFSGGHLNQILS